MFSIAIRSAARPIVTSSSRSSVVVPSALRRSMATVKEGLTATDAWSKSCYSGIDYTINEDLPVYDAVTKFAAYNVGCLVTVDSAGAISGVVSERDYVCKIALLGKTSKETKVKGVSLSHTIIYYCTHPILLLENQSNLTYTYFSPLIYRLIKKKSQQRVPTSSRHRPVRLSLVAWQKC